MSAVQGEESVPQPDDALDRRLSEHSSFEDFVNAEEDDFSDYDEPTPLPRATRIKYLLGGVAILACIVGVSATIAVVTTTPSIVQTSAYSASFNPAAAIAGPDGAYSYAAFACSNPADASDFSSVYCDETKYPCTVALYRKIKCCLPTSSGGCATEIELRNCQGQKVPQMCETGYQWYCSNPSAIAASSDPSQTNVEYTRANCNTASYSWLCDSAKSKNIYRQAKCCHVDSGLTCDEGDVVDKLACINQKQTEPPTCEDEAAPTSSSTETPAFSSSTSSSSSSTSSSPSSGQQWESWQAPSVSSSSSTSQGSSSSQQQSAAHYSPSSSSASSSAPSPAGPTPAPTTPPFDWFCQDPSAPISYERKYCSAQAYPCSGHSPRLTRCCSTDVGDVCDVGVDSAKCQSRPAPSSCNVDNDGGKQCVLPMPDDNNHLLYLPGWTGTGPGFRGFLNRGWAVNPHMIGCPSGTRCVYACNPPFVPSSQGYDNSECIPGAANCPTVYNQQTSKHGVYCDNGTPRFDPGKTQQWCVMGLITMKVRNLVNRPISACQTVYPGSEIPQIPVTTAGVGQPGDYRVMPAFPSNYWLGVHNHFYVNMAGTQEAIACQWNDDPNSLNSGGVDFYPYVVGGGYLQNSPTAGQNNLDMGDNFDPTKAGFPAYGMLGQNCRGDSYDNCETPQCVLTYRRSGNQIQQVWARYNTNYGSVSKPNPGCVMPAVNGVDQFTLVTYFPIDASGNCINSEKCSMVPPVPDSLVMIRDQQNANYGTGVKPGLYAAPVRYG